MATIWQHYRVDVSFLEKELTNEEVETVIKHTSFSNMKANPMTNGSRIPKIEGETDFMRKGKVGDWKNYFTEEQNQKIDKWIQQKNKEHSIPFVFVYSTGTFPVLFLSFEHTSVREVDKIVFSLHTV